MHLQDVGPGPTWSVMLWSAGSVENNSSLLAKSTDQMVV